MNTDIERLGAQFIVNEDMEAESVQRLVERMLNFCKVDGKGFVMIKSKKMKITDKLMLVLSARYLANRIQVLTGKEASISENIEAKELGRMIGEDHATVLARLKDLKDKNKAIALGKGVYKVAPHEIDSFLGSLETVS